MDNLLKIFLMAVGCGIGGSLLGILVAAFGKRNDDRLQMGNASGIGFLIGAGIGSFVGVFATLAGRL